MHLKEAERNKETKKNLKQAEIRSYSNESPQDYNSLGIGCHKNPRESLAEAVGRALHRVRVLALLTLTSCVTTNPIAGKMQFECRPKEHTASIVVAG